MPATFTAAEIIQASRGSLVQGRGTDTFVGVSTDSRTCQAGGLFIPLRGENHDGHSFIRQVLDKGRRPRLHPQGLEPGSARRGGGRTGPAPQWDHGPHPRRSNHRGGARHPDPVGDPGPSLAPALPHPGGFFNWKLRQDHGQGNDRPDPVPVLSCFEKRPEPEQSHRLTPDPPPVGR